MSDSLTEQGMADMIDKIKNLDTDVPHWDVALAALAGEEAQKLGRGLTTSDFRNLARQHAIRFDDIMVTMFELVIQGEWRYEDPPGVARLITREEVEKLYVGGRLVEPDLLHYPGSWIPL